MISTLLLRVSRADKLLYWADILGAAEENYPFFNFHPTTRHAGSRQVNRQVNRPGSSSGRSSMGRTLGTGNPEGISAPNAPQSRR